MLVRFVCRPILEWVLHLLHGHKTSPGKGVYGIPHFSEVCFLSDKESSKKPFFLHLLIPIGLQLKIILIAKGAYSAVAYSDPLQCSECSL